MKRNTRWNCLFKRIEWLAVSTAILLFASTGLAGYAQSQGHADPSNLAWMLLAMYAASWMYAIGVGGLIFVSAWTLVRAMTNCRH